MAFVSHVDENDKDKRFLHSCSTRHPTNQRWDLRDYKPLANSETVTMDVSIFNVTLHRTKTLKLVQEIDVIESIV